MGERRDLGTYLASTINTIYRIFEKDVMFHKESPTVLVEITRVIFTIYKDKSVGWLSRRNRLHHLYIYIYITTQR